MHVALLLGGFKVVISIVVCWYSSLIDVIQIEIRRCVLFLSIYLFARLDMRPWETFKYALIGISRTLSPSSCLFG